MKIFILSSLLAITAITVAILSNGKDLPPCKLKNIQVPGLGVASLSTAQFAALHDAVAPSGAGERWAEIPWVPDLTTARQRASRERKPLLMWVMDGNPLGCT